MTGHSAVGVDDDLAAGETRVSVRAADNETAGGVDVHLRLVVDELGGKDGVEDVLLDILVDLLLGHIGIVLGRKNDGFETAGLAVLVVFYRNLGLAVRTQILEGAVLADLCQLLGELMRQADGIGHVFVRLVRCVAEHHTLVAGTGIQVFRRVAALCFEGLVNTESNVG